MPSSTWPTAHEKTGGPPLPGRAASRECRFESGCWAGRDRLTGRRRSARCRTSHISLARKTTHRAGRKTPDSAGGRNQRCHRRDDGRGRHGRNNRRHHRRRQQRRHHRGYRRRQQRRHHRRYRRRQQRRHHRGRRHRRAGQDWNTRHFRDRSARRRSGSRPSRACSCRSRRFTRGGLQAVVSACLRHAGAQRQGDAAQPGTDGSHSDAESIKDRHHPPTPSSTLHSLLVPGDAAACLPHPFMTIPGTTPSIYRHTERWRNTPHHAVSEW